MGIGKNIRKISLLVILLSLLVLSGFQADKFLVDFVFAQGEQSADPAKERQQLEDELKKLEEEIAQYETDITKTQQQKKTLQNEISILKQKMQKLDLQIQQGSVMVRDISLQIFDTQSSIEMTSQRIGASSEQLKSVLRTIYEQDQESLIETFLTEKEFSDFFDDLVALESLGLKNHELLKEIKNLKVFLEGQKESLDDEKLDLERVISLQTLQRQESASTKQNKDWLLEKTAGKESEYQKLLAESKQKATEIRNRIFELIGVPDAPTFGEAVEIAKFVSGITGIRPAFLLAVLTQESNIGKNVGQCYLKDIKTGAGVTSGGKEIANVMKPSRDVQPFLTITQSLNRNPYNTPVSCPIPSVGGYGGAMGPAQFIPSTWIGYHNRIKEITGKPGDPWNIKDAFLAAALYLTDAGAAKRTETAEWRASLVYFSGSVNTKYRFYADSVLSIAAKYEEDIKAIENGN